MNGEAVVYKVVDEENGRDDTMDIVNELEAKVSDGSMLGSQVMDAFGYVYAGGLHCGHKICRREPTSLNGFSMTCMRRGFALATSTP